jgi:hypothetical protein
MHNFLLRIDLIPDSGDIGSGGSFEVLDVLVEL